MNSDIEKMVRDALDAYLRTLNALGGFYIQQVIEDMLGRVLGRPLLPFQAVLEEEQLVFAVPVAELEEEEIEAAEKATVEILDRLDVPHPTQCIEVEQLSPWSKIRVSHLPRTYTDSQMVIFRLYYSNVIFGSKYIDLCRMLYREVYNMLAEGLGSLAQLPMYNEIQDLDLRTTSGEYTKQQDGIILPRNLLYLDVPNTPTALESYSKLKHDIYKRCSSLGSNLKIVETPIATGPLCMHAVVCLELPLERIMESALVIPTIEELCK